MPVESLFMEIPCPRRASGPDVGILEDESNRLAESGQKWRGGIEIRPPADMSMTAHMEVRPALAALLDDGDEPPLFGQLRQDGGPESARRRPRSR